MPDILIRGFDAQLLKRLKARAKRNGRSLQSEAKMVLEQAAGPTMAEALERAAQWRKKLGRQFSNSADLIREDRER